MIALPFFICVEIWKLYQFISGPRSPLQCGGEVDHSNTHLLGPARAFLGHRLPNSIVEVATKNAKNAKTTGLIKLAELRAR